MLCSKLPQRFSKSSKPWVESGPTQGQNRPNIGLKLGRHHSHSDQSNLGSSRLPKLAWVGHESSKSGTMSSEFGRHSAKTRWGSTRPPARTRQNVERVRPRFARSGQTSARIPKASSQNHGAPTQRATSSGKQCQDLSQGLLER